MERAKILVNAVGYSPTSSTVLVAFREKICCVSVGVDDGRSSNALSKLTTIPESVEGVVQKLTNSVGHICTADITLQKRQLHLTRLEQYAGYGVHSTDPILVRGNENQLFLARWSVHERLCIPLLLGVVRICPQLTESR